MRWRRFSSRSQTLRSARRSSSTHSRTRPPSAPRMRFSSATPRERPHIVAAVAHGRSGRGVSRPAVTPPSPFLTADSSRRRPRFRWPRRSNFSVTLRSAPTHPPSPRSDGVGSRRGVPVEPGAGASAPARPYGSWTRRANRRGGFESVFEGGSMRPSREPSRHRLALGRSRALENAAESHAFATRGRVARAGRQERSPSERLPVRRVRRVTRRLPRMSDGRSLRRWILAQGSAAGRPHVEWQGGREEWRGRCVLGCVWE